MMDIKRQEEAFEKIKKDRKNILLLTLGKLQSGESPTKFTFESNGIYNYYKVSDFNNNYKYLINSKLKTNNSKNKISKNSIIFPKRGESINTNKIAILNSDGFIDTNLMAFTTERNIEYIFQYLSYFGLSKIADTSSIPQINNIHFEGFKVPYYINEKNYKIADFLTSLDSLIQKQEEYIEELKVQKKGYSQKIFNQKLRFNVYDDKWEKGYLNDLIFEKKQLNGNEYSKNDVLSVTSSGLFNQIEYLGRSFAGKELTKYKVIDKNNIVYTKSPLKEYPLGIIKYNQYQTGIISTLYAVYECENNSSAKFINYYFESSVNVNKYISPLVTKGAKNTINANNSDILKGRFKYPTFEEQQKIGDFLSTLDDNIELQEQKIEQLKLKKKYYLNKIFQ